MDVVERRWWEKKKEGEENCSDPNSENESYTERDSIAVSMAELACKATMRAQQFSF